MITTKIVLDTRTRRKDGTFPVKLYVSLNRETTRVGLGYYSVSENWDDTSYFTKKEPNYKIKNVRLRGILSAVEEKIIKLDKIDTKAVKAIIDKEVKGKDRPLGRFVDYMDEFVDTKTNKGTASVYATTRGKVAEFDENATFETIDAGWLRRFEAWMVGEGLGTNYISIQLRNIRAVFNYAIDCEYTALYPFRKFKIRTEQTAKRSLTVEQLRTLRDYEVEPYQEKYRDIFMLMFYLIGINSVDLCNLKESDIVNGRIEYRRAKTSKLYSIKIEPEAMEIIDRHRGKGYLLDILDGYSNYKDFVHRMNLGLKKVGEVERKGLGGKKHVTPLFPGISSYWSRHTWATIAAGLDIPKETIAEALGHSAKTVTDIYINFDKRKVDEANRKVIDFVNGKGG